MKSRTLLIVLAIAAGAVIVWAIWPARLRPRSKSTIPLETVDSLAFYRELQRRYGDTATQLHTQNEKDWKVYRDTAAMATPRWDSLRTTYRDSVRAGVRRKLARQSGSL